MKNKFLPVVSLTFLLSALTFSAVVLSYRNATKDYAPTKAGEIDDLSDMTRMPSMSFYGDTTSQMAFTWNTTNYDDSNLQVVEKSIGDFTSSEVKEFNGTIEKGTVSNDAFIHRAIATGLKANTEYLYRFGDKELGVWCETGSFKTTSNTNRNFQFAHISDPQGWEAIHYEAYTDLLTVIDEQDDVEFMALTGDIVNNSWAEHTPVLNQWEWALTDQWPILKDYPIAPVSGNHDAASNDFNSRYTLNTPEGADTDSGVYYSFDYEGVHFTALNTNDTLGKEEPDIARGLSDAQLRWVEEDLKAHQNDKFRIVLMHKGIFDSGAHSTNNSGEDYDIAYIRAQLAPLFTEYHVNLVLQGHDHLYSLSYPTVSYKEGDNIVYQADSSYEIAKKVYFDEKMDVFTKTEGTVYLNSGSASGSKYYVPQTNMDPNIFHIYKTEGLTSQCYTIIDVLEDAIVARTYITDGYKREKYASFAIEFASSNHKKDDKNNQVNIPLIVGLSVGGTVLVAGGVVAFILIRKKKGKK